MSKWNDRLRRWLIKYVGLPSDVILQLPKITIIGQLHIYIENHQGLVGYTDTELRLKTQQGYVRIIGSSFVLKMMHQEEILLEGKITDVQFITDG